MFVFMLIIDKMTKTLALLYTKAWKSRVNRGRRSIPECYSTLRKILIDQQSQSSPPLTPNKILLVPRLTWNLAIKTTKTCSFDSYAWHRPRGPRSVKNCDKSFRGKYFLEFFQTCVCFLIDAYFSSIERYKSNFGTLKALLFVCLHA